MLPEITDGELRVLETLWETSPLTASQIAQKLHSRVGWNKNTTYTFIGRLVDKALITRTDPGFLCAATVTREEAGVSEGRSFLKRIHSGSLSMMVAGFIKSKSISPDELAELRRLISESEVNNPEQPI